MFWSQDTRAFYQLTFWEIVQIYDPNDKSSFLFPIFWYEQVRFFDLWVKCTSKNPPMICWGFQFEAKILTICSDQTWILPSYMFFINS